MFILSMLDLFLSNSHTMIYKKLFIINPNYIQSINSLENDFCLWVVWHVFISVSMINLMCLETDSYLWVVHAMLSAGQHAASP